MPEPQKELNIQLESGKIGEQLLKLPEPQLQQIVYQANAWADTQRFTGMMKAIAQEMKEIAELPSEIPQDSNPLLRVEFPEKGGVLTWMEGYEHPFKGYPFHEFVDRIDAVKKMFRAWLSGLYHQLKRRNRLWLLTLIPGLWVSKAAVRASINVIYRIIERFRIKKERYCDALREVHRAFSGERLNESVSEREIRHNFRDSLCMVLEFDNAYRYRFQDILAHLDKVRLYKNPIKELVHLLDLMSEREVTQEIRDTWKLLKYVVRFYLVFDRKFLRMITETLMQLDIDKVALSVEDKVFCLPRKDYKFGFVLYPNENDLRLIAKEKLNRAWKDEKASILKQSTEEHQLAKTDEERKALDEKFNNLLKASEERYVEAKSKL